MSKFERTISLFGEEKFKKLQNTKVLIFGIGGVGGYATEALARAGIEDFCLVDGDVVAESNINRQIIATTKTVGQPKVKVMKERILDINPDARVETKKLFYLPENSKEIDFEKFDYIIDAIDTVSAKLDIIEQAKKHNKKIISAMGAGNKIDVFGFVVADIFDTKVCPLAKIMRKELKARGVESLKVVYSQEKPFSTTIIENGKRIPSSNSFVPGIAGLTLAGEVIKEITECKSSTI